MNRNIFKPLLDKFISDDTIENKVEFLLQHDLRQLTNPQIEKLLNCLNEADTKKLISVISKKIEE
ncbi:hypothetical protein ACSW8S_18215 (plasmid) [Clostridium perfringens]